MSLLTKTAKAALAVLPGPLKEAARSVMPLSLKRSLGASLMKEAVGEGGPKTITVKDGRKFKVIEDRLFLRVLFDLEYEPTLSSVATRLIQSGDTIVDVGANFGWYTTLFSKAAGNGKVVAYEPSQRTYKVLSENIAHNSMQDQIDARNVCVGDEAGSVMMETGSTSESGLAHVVQEAGETTTEVPIVRLDEDNTDILGKIAYLKMDVEGYEMHALQGATKLLDVDNQPVIQIELNDFALNRADSSRNAVLQLLKDAGYKFWEVSASGRTLTQNDSPTASDVFCFGRGEFGQRFKNVS